jgi:DNA-nicking Smr family endonuclease
MSRKRPLSDDERVLWSTVTRSIAPLKGRKAAFAEELVAASAPEKPKPGDPAAAVLPPLLPVHRRATVPLPLQPLDRRTRQKLARGSTEIGGRIDLHGLTQADAHAALGRFLRGAQARDVKVVLVITGKGGAAGEGRGVLKRQVPLWLEGVEFRSLVIGFDTAGTGHGGEGALYVRVRRGR